MSKLQRKKIIFSSSDGCFVEVRFFLTIKKNNQKTKSSFSLVFEVIERPNDDEVIVESSKLGEFLIENILEKEIIKYHPPNTYYDSLQLRIASDTLQVLETLKYDYPTKRGTADLSENETKILGNYSCSFKKDSRRGQLVLRIKNMIAYPKMDYFINSVLLEPLILTIEKTEDESSSDSVVVKLKLVGLTLNNVFDEMYDYFDEIIEKIN